MSRTVKMIKLAGGHVGFVNAGTKRRNERKIIIAGGFFWVVGSQYFGQ